MMQEPSKSNWKQLDWLEPNAPLPGEGSPSGTGNQLIFDYRPNPLMVVLGIIFFGACGLFMADKAQTNDRGVIINHVIPLSKDGATIFYWVLAILSFTFVAAALLCIPMFFIKRQVIVDDTSVTVPGGPFSARHHRIDVSDIRAIDVGSYRKNVFIKIRHANGISSINSGMLPRHEDALTILECLRRRWSQLKERTIPCPKCGYDLRPSETGICPECGTNAV